MTPSADDPLLLTPGPLTTSPVTKQAMLRDRGSREPDFIATTARVRRRLVELMGEASDLTCVPVQGSGTFAVEATLGSLVPASGKVLILSNGVYGRRMATMCRYWGRAHVVLETEESVPNDPEALDQALGDDLSITHVAVVHCETTTGIMNPVGEIAEVTADHGRGLIVDAMSTFGALELGSYTADAVVASANKCLEGVPGFGFAIVRQQAIQNAKGNAPSLSLDLYEQWAQFEADGQWRFTPPTHVVTALDQALDELTEEGGVKSRGERYRQNREVLVSGMRDMRFASPIPDAVQSPIITTWYYPKDSRFDFPGFCELLRLRSYAIYPGKLTQSPTFRIGCIGRVDADDMRGVLAAVRTALDAMGVVDGAPPTA